MMKNAEPPWYLTLALCPDRRRLRRRRGPRPTPSASRQFAEHGPAWTTAATGFLQGLAESGLSRKAKNLTVIVPERAGGHGPVPSRSPPQIAARPVRPGACAIATPMAQAGLSTPACGSGKPRHLHRRQRPGGRRAAPTRRARATVQRHRHLRRAARGRPAAAHPRPPAGGQDHRHSLHHQRGQFRDPPSSPTRIWPGTTALRSWTSGDFHRR